jgi:hypothetical protein
LVDDDAVARDQASCRRTEFTYHAGDLVPENLRVVTKRARTPVGVEVVVCVAGDNVRVGTTQSDGFHADHHLVRRWPGALDVLNLKAAHVDQDRGAHPQG